jgi:hypothetical protein
MLHGDFNENLIIGCDADDAIDIISVKATRFARPGKDKSC